MGKLNLFSAFKSGLLSFISPCLLPNYPAFFILYYGNDNRWAYEEEKSIFDRHTILHTNSFLLGFSIIYVIGFATFFIGSFFYVYKN